MQFAGCPLPADQRRSQDDPKRTLPYFYAACRIKSMAYFSSRPGTLRPMNALCSCLAFATTV